MQACFVEEKWDDEFKEKVVDKILKENLGVLWGMKLEVDDAKIRMMEKSEAFEEFKKSFLDGNLGVRLFFSFVVSTYILNPYPSNSRFQILTPKIHQVQNYQYQKR